MKKINKEWFENGQLKVTCIDGRGFGHFKEWMSLKLWALFKSDRFVL